MKHVERPYYILNSISRKTVSSSSKTILAPTSIFSKFVWIIFKRILKVIWIRVRYISRHLKQNYTTLNYTLHDITQHHVQIWHHAKRNGGVIENEAIPLKFSEGDIVGVSSHNFKNQKGTQTIMFVLLYYGIKYFNSRELFSKIKPILRSHMILSFMRFSSFREKKLFLIICNNRAC